MKDSRAASWAVSELEARGEPGDFVEIYLTEGEGGLKIILAESRRLKAEAVGGGGYYHIQTDYLTIKEAADLATMYCSQTPDWLYSPKWTEGRPIDEDVVRPADKLWHELDSRIVAAATAAFVPIAGLLFFGVSGASLEGALWCLFGLGGITAFVFAIMSYPFFLNWIISRIERRGEAGIERGFIRLS